LRSWKSRGFEEAVRWEVGSERRRDLGVITRGVGG
jgi:hypothetical protein